MAAALASLVSLHAQENAQKKTADAPAVYRLEFDVRDASEASAQPRRHYAMVVDESRKGIFQAGNRIPQAASAPEGPYYDVGTTLECVVRTEGDKVEVQGTIELSEMGGTVNINGISEPLIGQMKMAFHQSVAPGVAVQIFAAGKYQVEATVTRVDSPVRLVQRPNQRVDGVVAQQ
jgi:hypothetical protein